MTSEPNAEPAFAQAPLHRTLRLAARALGLPDAVLLTAQALLRFVPKDAEEAISPARVGDLAEERNCDPRTVRAHIRRLEAYGLVVDRSAGGGRRVIQRRRGRIVALQGVDFTPMLARAEALARAALEREAEQDERRRLVARVSARKRALRLALIGTDSALVHHAKAVLDACPARHRALPLGALAALEARLAGALRLLSEEKHELPAGRRVSSDRSAEIIRPITEKKDEKTVPDVPRAGGETEVHGLTPRLLVEALPGAPRSWLAKETPVTWSALIAFAEERGAEIGVPPKIQTEASSRIGPAGAAALVLLADAGSGDGAARIRCPAAWVRAMARRAAERPLDLRRNLLALARPRRDGPCPALVRSRFHSSSSRS